MSEPRPAKFSTRQKRKLSRLIADAAANVPFYAQRLASVKLDPDDPHYEKRFREIPTLSKKELLQVEPAARINRRFASTRLVTETTTGSTGEPYSQYMEPAYRRARNWRFLRSLFAAGYRPWQRLMLLTETEASAVRHMGRWHYVPINNRAADIANAVRRWQPQTLYGCTTPLRILAEQLAAGEADFTRPRLVITTAEMLDPGTRALLEKVFDAPVRDFYGLTEMGLVAWQDERHKHYISESKSVLTELMPIQNQPKKFRIVMTNLDLRAAPLIRFESGDVAEVRDGEIVAFEGRELDVLTAHDGARISPYEVTIVLQDIAGLRRFKLIELAIGEFELHVEADAAACASIGKEAHALLERLYGAEVTLNLSRCDQLIPDGARKFRTVESRLEATTR